MKQSYITPSPELRVGYIPGKGPSKGVLFTFDFDTEAKARTYLAEIRRLLTKAGEFNEDERFVIYAEEWP